MLWFFTNPINSKTIRVVKINKEPWFVGADVCQALNIYMTTKGPNTTVMARILDLDEFTLCSVQGKMGRRTAMVISQAGLFRVLFRSDAPDARAFQRWLAHDVLPELADPEEVILYSMQGDHWPNGCQMVTAPCPGHGPARTPGPHSVRVFAPRIDDQAQGHGNTPPRPTTALLGPETPTQDRAAQQARRPPRPRRTSPDHGGPRAAPMVNDASPFQAKAGRRWRWT